MADKSGNFGKAMFDMFGVGKEDSAPAQAKPVQAKPAQAKPVQPKPEVKADAFAVAPEVKPVKTGKTVIAEGTVLEGMIRSKGDIEIMGEFKGNIYTDGKVTVMSKLVGTIEAGNLVIIGTEVTGDAVVKNDFEIDGNSAITGNIASGNITCLGRVFGDLDIKENMTLGEKAEINGNIKMGSMSVAKGAKITGKVEMQN